MTRQRQAILPPDLSGHIPSLDGLRAFSVLLVLIGHVAATHGAPLWLDKPAITSLGNIGVRFFFLISGFLITTLLLREHARTGRIDLGQFYLRRAYRILPAAFTYIGVIWLAFTSLLRLTWSTDSTWWALITPQLMQGLGMPFFFVGLTTFSISAMKPENIASAAGIVTFARTMAGAVATAVASTLWLDNA